MMVKRHRNGSIGISSGVMDRRYEPELVSRLRAFQLGPYFSYSLSQGVVPDAIETEVCRRGINKCRARSTSGERSSQRCVFPESFPSIDLREAARLKTRVREFLSESAIYRALDRGRVQNGRRDSRVRSAGRTRPTRRHWRTNDRSGLSTIRSGRPVSHRRGISARVLLWHPAGTNTHTWPRREFVWRACYTPWWTSRIYNCRDENEWVPAR